MASSAAKFYYFLWFVLAIFIIVGSFIWFCSWSASRYDQNDFDLDSNQLSITRPYSKNDSVCFIDRYGHVEGFVVKSIKRKEKKQGGIFLALPAYNYFGVEVNYFPKDLWISHSVDGNRSWFDYQSLISIENSPQTKHRSCHIEFKNFSSKNNVDLGLLHKDSICIGSRMITNYYQPERDYQERAVESTDVKDIFWTIQDGLVAYKTVSGDYWVKINLK